MQPTEDDSLLQSLLLLARYHGLSASAESLTRVCRLRVKHCGPDVLVRAAQRAGLNARLRAIPLADLPAGVLPTVLLLKDERACLLLEINASGMATVIYPDLVDGEVQVPVTELEAAYNGYALLARPRFRFDERVSDGDFRREGHWFWSALRENTPVYRDVLLAALFINVFALAVPLFTMNVYDRVVPNAAFETLWMLASGVFIVLAADLLLKSLRGYFLDLASRRVDVSLSSRIMEQALGMRLEHKPASVGSFAVNLRSFETLRDFITSATITTVVDLPFAIIFFAVIAWIAWPLLVPLVLGVLAIVAWSLAMRPRLIKMTETTYQAGALRNATLIESLTGMETLKAIGAESVMQRKWEESTRFLASVGVRLRATQLSVTQVTGFIQQLITVMVIVTGVYLISDGQLTMGGLIAATMLAGRSVAPFGMLAGLITQAHNARIAMTSLDGLFDTPVEHREEGAFVSRDSFNGAIRFKGVSFAYPGSELAALANVSISIKPGERVAILGRVGSGKSTITRLGMGLFQPTDGQVLIDGIDMRQLEPREFRRAVGYMPQEITLFHGTLRENLTLAHRGITDEALIAAASRAGLTEFINQHPSGFDMPISERGESLSGGQRRAIGLARALVHEPQILILDEPTGSMDHSTEQTVIETLSHFVEGRTLLVVTHRNSILKLVDRIIVMDAGKVVADGPRDAVVSALQQGRIGKAQ
jgi:ATP-binding cassette subfamily C protein LapB